MRELVQRLGKFWQGQDASEAALLSHPLAPAESPPEPLAQLQDLSRATRGRVRKIYIKKKIELPRRRHARPAGSKPNSWGHWPTVRWENAESNGNGQLTSKRRAGRTFNAHRERIHGRYAQFRTPTSPCRQVGWELGPGGHRAVFKFSVGRPLQRLIIINLGRPTVRLVLALLPRRDGRRGADDGDGGPGR